MSSINPVILLPGALRENAEEIASQLHRSCSLGTGQFCTKPGLTIPLKNEKSESFLNRLTEMFQNTEPGILLGKPGAANIAKALRTLTANVAEILCRGREAEGPAFSFQPTLLRVSGRDFLANPKALQTEAFGTVALLLIADDLAQARECLRQLEGNFIGSIYSATDGSDDAAYEKLEPVLRHKVGRLLNDKMPTGVAVFTSDEPRRSLSRHRSPRLLGRRLSGFSHPLHRPRFLRQRPPRAFAGTTTATVYLGPLLRQRPPINWCPLLRLWTSCETPSKLTHSRLPRYLMFTQAFHDLLKPQWLATLAELKTSGGLAVSELSRRLDSSYMTIKQHCESLTKLGYLQRSRVPRTEIGRPEIFYRLSEKAETLFPSIPPAFTMGMLDQMRHMFGETAPEKLLFQYFQGQEEIWKARLFRGTTSLHKAELFSRIREQDGLFIRCIQEHETGGITLREFHHPLREVFEKFPRAITMEQRAMEAAFEKRFSRNVVASASGLPSYIDFVMAP